MGGRKATGRKRKSLGIEALKNSNIRHVVINDKLPPIAIPECVGIGPGGRVWDGSVILARFVYQEYNLDNCSWGRVLEIGAGCGLPAVVAHKLGARVVVVADREQYAPLLETCVRSNFGIWNEAPHAKVKCDAQENEPKQENNKSGYINVVNQFNQRVAARHHEAYNLEQDHYVSKTFMAATLEWGSKLNEFVTVHGGTFDVLLASEVVGVGTRDLFEPLIETLLAVSHPGTRLYLSHRRRAEFEEEFFQLMKPHFELKRSLEHPSTIHPVLGLASDFYCRDESVVVFEFVRRPTSV